MLAKLNFFAFCALIVFCFSCSPQKNPSTTSASSTPASLSDSLVKTSIELIDYPKDFLVENKLEDWETFEELHQSLERLKNLNFDGIEVDLLALTTRIKRLRSGSIPRKLNTPQITSRLKVVEMQVMKARYFTQYYKKDSLLPAVELIYTHYNDFVKRMISLQNESQSVADSEETLIPE
ncbi:MAG: hypothetical protein VW261_05235 [Flavobacteriaceae bacterium]